MNKRTWTIDEDNYIKENFNKITMSELSKHLNCSIETVKKRARELGFIIEDRKVRRWTDEEIILLKEMAPKYLNKTIAHKLNRTKEEVNKKARLLGIKLIYKRPVWKKWQIDYLIDNINKQSIRKISAFLNISYYHIMDKLDELNIEYECNRWTDEEIEILTNLAEKVYICEIAKVLNRTEGAVITKARKMGLKYITLKHEYTLEEINYIKNNWGKIPISEIARKLKVSRMMLQSEADILKLPKLGNNPYRKWTDKEVALLEKLAKTMTIEQLAKKFKTTYSAIITIAYKKGIYLNDSKIHWTDEDKEKLEELAKTKTVSEIALEMGKNIGAVRAQAKRQNLKLMKDKKAVDKTWSNDDIEKLKELASKGLDLLSIAIILKKNDETVFKKGLENGLNIEIKKERPWTIEDIEELKSLAPTKYLVELMIILKRRTSSIKRAAKKHGIKLLSDKKTWTIEECKYLEELIMQEKKTPQEVAQILGRSEDAIIVKLNRIGLQIQTNDKKYWTKEEEDLLSDLWGARSIENICEVLNRSESSIKNKAFLLNLGPYMENNFEGLTISEISEIMGISRETISISWVGLGLKYKVKRVSKSKTYVYVEISDLLEFLEKNQNIWDSRCLEKNILGEEPEWLIKKRKEDINKPKHVKSLNIARQQLILDKKLDLDKDKIYETIVSNEDSTNPKVKAKKK